MRALYFAPVILSLLALVACRDPDAYEVLPCNTAFPCADGYACADGACVEDDADVLAANTAACREMCEHLVTDLGGCGVGDATTVDTCTPECALHLNADATTEPQVRCGASALSCDDWSACGDLL